MIVIPTSVGLRREDVLHQRGIGPSETLWGLSQCNCQAPCVERTLSLFPRSASVQWRPSPSAQLARRFGRRRRNDRRRFVLVTRGRCGFVIRAGLAALKMILPTVAS